jgi:hypothetical protein
MDAVVFMDAVQRPREAAPPPPPRERRPRMSANASLIAGIGTLVLAIGVGVLIGRTGEQGSPTAAATPQVITVPAGSGTAPEAGEEKGGTAKKGGGGSGKSKSAATAKAETGDSGTTKATEEVFKPTSGVKLPPPKVQPGGSCESGSAGCENGKFSGNFFGE